MTWLKLHSSVGDTPAKNNGRDVKIVQALLNVYLRRKKQKTLKISDKIDDDTKKAITEFQTKHLKMAKPDGRVDPHGRMHRELLKILKSSYTTKAIVAPDYGVVTWASEGAEGGPYHSRKLHVPNGVSGLTVGRGYDFKEKKQSTVISDLTSAGLEKERISILKTAVTLYGNTAKQFIIDHDLLDYEIPVQAQKKLFEVSYKAMLNDVKRISKLHRIEKVFGKVDFDKLDKNILDVLVDLRFRGDYTGRARDLVQNAVVKNDLKEFAKQISDKTNWPKVPPDRFNRRKRFIENAK